MTPNRGITLRATLGPAGLALSLILMGGCGGAGLVAEDGVPPDTTAHPTPAPKASEPGAEVGRWRQMARSPLAPRYRATGVWTGDEMLVLGGLTSTGRFASLNADSYARDVAAYDPSRDTWRTLAPAPFAPMDLSTVVLARTIYVLDQTIQGERYLWAYNLDADTWRRLAGPPAEGVDQGVNGIVAAGSKLYAWHFDRKAPADLLYDPAKDKWSRAPVSPLGGSLYGSVLGLPDGRVVSVGLNLSTPLSGGRRFYDAAVFDPKTRAWKRTPKAPFLEGSNNAWAFAGGRVVNLDPETYTRTRGGRKYPSGAELDVDTRTWSPLPGHPNQPGTLGWATTSGGDVALLRGWVLDVPRGRWTKLPEIRDAVNDLAFPALAWTGAALLAWGGRGDTNPGGVHGQGWFTTDRGWIWEPPANLQ